MNTELSSAFESFISGLIATKRASGYTYETDEYHLHRFDAYCSARPMCRSLSRELVHGWTEAKEGEDPATHRRRTSPIRELGRYMQSLGISEAFVLPRAFSLKARRYVPHFFTPQEITAFFA